jgi:hypothetical protein
MIKYAEVLENKAADKMINDVHKLSLSLIKHQHIEMIMQLTLIQK